MAASEISHLIELNKRKAELEFKKGYLLRKGRSMGDAAIASLEHEIAEMGKQALELESRIMVRETVIFYPHEKEIAALSSEIAKFMPEEIDRAMENREGEAYGLLEERGKFIKGNFENRKEIAALIEFVNSLPSRIRDETIERVMTGEVGELDASTLNEKSREKLFRLLNRSGIRCMMESYKIVTESRKGSFWDERMVELNGARVWVSPENEEKARKLGAELAETSRAIQVMNAEREIRKFSAEEQKNFGSMQKRYLEMIRRRDALIEG